MHSMVPGASFLASNELMSPQNDFESGRSSRKVPPWLRVKVADPRSSPVSTDFTVHEIGVWPSDPTRHHSGARSSTGATCSSCQIHGRKRITTSFPGFNTSNSRQHAGLRPFPLHSIFTPSAKAIGRRPIRIPSNDPHDPDLHMECLGTSCMTSKPGSKDLKIDSTSFQVHLEAL